MLKKFWLVGLLLGLTTGAQAQFAQILNASGEVYRVVDGDTYIVNIGSEYEYLRLKAEAVTEEELEWFNDQYQSVRVRLANTDTAESVHRDYSRNHREGKTISSIMSYRLTDRRVGLRCWDFGKYGRLICSVALGGMNGEDIGLRVITEGMSPYITRYGRHPYLDQEYQAANTY